MPITSVASAPPPKNSSNTSSNNRPSSRVTKEREELVAQLGMFAQVPLIATRQFADAGAIALHWPSVAKELAHLAETQEPIARIIDPLIQVGPYAGLIAAVLPLAMQLAVNHGRIKPGSLGTVPGVALASQIETAMARQELAAMHDQMEAERQAAESRAEIERMRKDIAAESANVSA